MGNLVSFCCGKLLPCSLRHEINLRLRQDTVSKVSTILLLASIMYLTTSCIAKLLLLHTKSNQKICREEKPFRKIVALQCNLFRKPSFRRRGSEGKKKVWKPIFNITGKNVVISSDYFHFFWGPLGSLAAPRLLPNKHLINASRGVYPWKMHT